jgi:RNA polymerase sigma-70 factor (ECF subfamily)
MDDTALNFEKIYAAYHPRVLRYLNRLVGEDEAEDLAQVVFTRVSQNLHTFRGESQLSTWIFRIAANAAFDRMRQPSFRQKRHALPLEDASAVEGTIEDLLLWTGEPAPSIEQQVHRKQREECYCGVLNDLPENYRVVVLLSEIEGFCAKEIADILGLSVDVVKIRLHRGRQKLLEMLKKHCRAEDWL